MRGIASLFPADVVTVEAGEDAWDAALLPEEEVCVRRAVAKRRREFAAGRACAREALARLGIRDFALLAGEDRAPLWPEGIVGSITHTGDYCAVAVARREDVGSIGFDAEDDAPLEERLHPTVLTTPEIAHLGRLPRLAGVDWPKLVFSAKESVYKCWYPVWGAGSDSRLGFHDVEIEIDPDGGLFEAQISRLPPLRGRYLRAGERFFTAVTLPRGGSV